MSEYMNMICAFSGAVITYILYSLKVRYILREKFKSTYIRMRTRMYREIAGMKAELEAARTMILAYQSKHEEFVSVIKDMGHTIENQDGPYRERYEETMAKLLSVQNELSDARNKISILSSQVDGTVEEQMRFAFQQEITTLQEMAASAYDDLMVKYQAEHSKNLALANALELANKKLRYKGEEVTVKGVN